MLKSKDTSFTSQYNIICVFIQKISSSSVQKHGQQKYIFIFYGYSHRFFFNKVLNVRMAHYSHKWRVVNIYLLTTMVLLNILVHLAQHPTMTSCYFLKEYNTNNIIIAILLKCLVSGPNQFFLFLLRWWSNTVLSNFADMKSFVYWILYVNMCTNYKTTSE